MTACEVVVRHAVPMTCSDGVRLLADLYLPSGCGPDRRVPAVLVRTPYSRAAARLISEIDLLRLAQAGIAAVTQDTRGRHGSEGAFGGMLADEEMDGLETLRWVAAQPWCDGRIGMAGGSYNGFTQLLCLAHDPPELVAVAPRFCGSLAEVRLPGGVFGLAAFADWTQMLAESELQRRAPDAALAGEIGALRERGPRERLEAFLRPGSALRSLTEPMAPLVEHDTFDAWWRQWELAERTGDAHASGLHVGGWFDAMVRGTVDVWRAARRGPAGDRQHLIVGPWGHGAQHALYPDLSFGPLAGGPALGLMERQLAFFRAVLLGDYEAAGELAPVEVFVTGANEWRRSDDWPPPAMPVAWHLGADGALAPNAPPRLAGADRYVYDPAAPTPSCGGRTAFHDMLTQRNVGPREQAAVEARADVLVYTGEPLPRAVEVAGSVTAELFVATTAEDTDVAARLTDVHPDGRSYVFADGIVRLSAHDREAELQPVAPGELRRVRIDLGPVHHVFHPGHRVRLQVTSSDFPRYLPHPNVRHRLADGALPQGQPATQTVAHGSEHPSALWLPTTTA